MSSKLYDLYLKDVLALARTIVIKSEAAANAINNALMQVGVQVDLYRPKTWKYYLNLAGEYGPGDVPMTITSFDTLEEIAFTRATMREHKATAKAYVYGTPYYQALVERYPNQELLIRGILSPIDMDTAIAAADHQILWYDTNLVEDQETNLVEELQLVINAFYQRWYISAYGIYHELYDSAALAVMYGHLPETILGIRLKNCHTNRAHSFHIWTFLAGQGNLDVYRDYLTTKQALWLYRNIRYINNNAGKASTFKMLIQHMLTERGIPAASYSLVHDTSNLPTDLVPAVKMAATPLNLKHIVPPGGYYKTVQQVVDQEDALARQNEEYNAEEVENATFKMAHSNFSRLPTKVVESNAIDSSDSEVFTLPDVLLNHWMYMVHKNLYRAMISAVHPNTGEIVTMSVKDAFLLWFYAEHKAVGITHTHLPLLQAKHVRKIKVPSFNELRVLADKPYVTDQMINETYENLPPVGLTVSTEGFFDLCHQIHQHQLWHFRLYSVQDHLKVRAQYEQVVEHHNWHYALDFGQTVTYESWFDERGLNFDSLQQADWELFAKELLNKATGSDTAKRFSLRDIQSAILRLMSQLSSYTIQFIQSMSTEKSIPVGTPTHRIGDVNSEGGNTFSVMVPEFRVLGLKERETSGHAVGLVGEQLTNVDVIARQTVDSDQGVSIGIFQVPVCEYKVLLPGPRFDLIETTEVELSPDLARLVMKHELNDFEGY